MGLSMNRTTLVAIGFAIFGGYLLWSEHSAHIALAIPYLPWLILLACPLLHMFMHGGHGYGRNRSGGQDNAQDLKDETSSRRSAEGGRNE